jgi:hypothetical protein
MPMLLAQWFDGARMVFYVIQSSFAFVVHPSVFCLLSEFEDPTCWHILQQHREKPHVKVTRMTSPFCNFIASVEWPVLSAL